jgi:CBS domain-containing protein
MKTASIGHRVADFLRRYPPFQYVDENELLELARDGRVQFHECDEIVFQQGQPRKRFVYVIQRGVVRLIEETDRGNLLRDIRGEGDLLGIGRFLGDPGHRFTARTDKDVILYALPADSFAALVDRHPRVSRFLSPFFSVAAGPSKLEGQEDSAEKPRLGQRPVDWMWRVVSDSREPVTCPTGTSARDAARILALHRGAAAVVTESGGVPIGVIGLRSLSGRIATGELPLDTPVDRFMDPPPPVAPAGLEAGEYLIRMLQSERDQVALTQKHPPDASLVGIVSRDDLDLLEGATLIRILEDMAGAPDPEALVRLYSRAEAFLSAGLTGPESLRWLGPVAGVMKAAVLRRVVTLAEELEADGKGTPGLAHCWVFFGTTGRNELLTRDDLEYGMIYETPAGDAHREARDYFFELGLRVDRGMSACGFGAPGAAIVADRPSAWRSLSEWESAFTGWIRDPIENGAYRATSYFDMRAACGDDSLVRELLRHIDAEKRENPNFVRLLANDSMENLPPLTFFRGLVIDDEGAEVETLDLKRATLDPVVDVARTLALDSACTQNSTLGRLAEARAFFGDDEQLLSETSSAFTNALYQRARAGFSEGTDGSRIDPRTLTRYEQALLKSGFKTVLRLLEHAGRRYGLLPDG